MSEKDGKIFKSQDDFEVEKKIDFESAQDAFKNQVSFF
jgi:hypothetical protein